MSVSSEAKQNLDFKDVEAGPLGQNNRKHRDFLCCLLFLLNIVGMVYCTIHAYINGNPNNIYKSIGDNLLLLMRKSFILFFMLVCFAAATLLDPSALQSSMFTTQITGDFKPVQPTRLGISSLWPLPIEVYEISAMRANIQLLPSGFPSTPMFAYAPKINGVFKPSYPGPVIVALKNSPVNIIWSNNIQGSHLLPIDTSPPLDMIKQYLNEVPIVPHAHGLQTQMGSDGQPMGFWTTSGRKGPDYFSFSSRNKKSNQAIFRYQNTKQGLFWFHDHAMTITRLNVYAGLVGYYQIVDPIVSMEQRNIMTSYGDFERRHFVIIDKSFNTDGTLFYPNQAQSSLFKSWVPQFFGNTITVNGKVWPKVNLKPKKYRIVLLNGCQSRYLDISFVNNGKALNFQIFRRDSDYLSRPLSVKNHLLLISGRIEIFLDLTKVTGEVIMKNSAVTPFPMGTAPDQYTSQIMKIVVGNPNNYVPALKYLGLIKNKLNFYLKAQNISSIYQQAGLDFIDQAQAPNYNDGASPSRAGGKVIKGIDYLDSIDNDNIDSINFVKTATSSMSTSYSRSTASSPNMLRNFIMNTNNLLKTVQNYELKKSSSGPVPITNVPYPRFSQGNAVFPVLVEMTDPQGQVASVMIDAVGLKYGCQGSHYKVGQTYDFYIINLTMDDHPLHIHLVNFQVIGRFAFDSKRYLADYQAKNGKFGPHGLNKIPRQIDVRPYQTSPTQAPLEEQRLFTDVIRARHGTVTIARVKISNHYGKPFPFDATGSKYVWHCHILEHEDNEMMRYFCLD